MPEKAIEVAAKEVAKPDKPIEKPVFSSKPVKVSRVPSSQRIAPPIVKEASESKFKTLADNGVGPILQQNDIYTDGGARFKTKGIDGLMQRYGEVEFLLKVPPKSDEDVVWTHKTAY